MAKYIYLDGALVAPEDAKVSVFDQDLSERRVRYKIPQHVGYVFQNPDHQLFTRRVYDEVAYGLENLSLPSGERDDIIRKTLETVGLLDLLEEDPLFLGKGQRQRAYLSIVEEQEFLAPFVQQAEHGKVPTAVAIRQALEARLARSVSESTVYRLLKRRGWRKLVPRPRHVESAPLEQEEFKKTP